MAKKKKIPEKYQRWIDARKRFYLSHAHIQMARLTRRDIIIGIEKISGIVTDRGGRVENPLLHPTPIHSFSANSIPSVLD